ncbi:glycosyltransferase [Sulfurimonas sp. HSL1-2]|uniref:glycosyltransferase n=1 Tax=Thiomicrolovo zhangzhouensis TaxID=3131933 RepID=UPI0031F7CAC9
MPKKINLLFVSIAFPPKSDPECLQTAKYFKYLVRDQGFEIDVVTSTDDTVNMPADQSLVRYGKGYRQMIQAGFFENRYVSFLLRKIHPDILKYPDSKFRFYRQWKKVVKRLQNRPDVIYSRSYPLSSTLMAYYLQKHYKVPWVLHLSDPWTLNPLHDFGKAGRWNASMEKACFEDAACIAFSSSKTMELYRKKYPDFTEKFRLSPNVFDPEDKTPQTYKLKDKLTVVYTGGLVGERSPEKLFEAIANMERERPEVLRDFDFVFAGALDRKNRALFDREIMGVRHIGSLSFPDALKLQRQADMLLVIDSPFHNPEDAQFFPSKLLDYMLMQRRIIALTDRGSMSWEIIEGQLGNCFAHGDTEGLSTALIDAWHAWKRKDESYFMLDSPDDMYAADYNVERLGQIFREVAGEK